MTVPVTFVTPRYGADVLGGAEAGARQLAIRLAADGREVTVITSCASSMQTWADDYPAGETIEEGVRVVRCAVDRRRAADFDALSDRVLPRAGEVSTADALDWIDQQGPTSASLLDAVGAVDDGVLVFYPYLYHPTVRGLPRARVPTILYPAAHREAPLLLPVFDDVFSGAAGLALQTRAEQALVHERFPATITSPQALVGLPVEMAESPDPEVARRALGLGDEPFALCLGRVDRGKGTHDLVDRFARFRAARGHGRLVLAGPVAEAPPAVDGVVCLGPIAEEHKFGLIAAADVLINPSFFEAFSIVILEAWLAGTPVLVNGWCAPMVEHVENSGGGLHYTGLLDFEIALGRLLEDAPARATLAAAGNAYVRRSYGWPAVSARLDGLIERVS
ncbi:MAG: glycosyltransferase family 4 protein [Acidimicrobiales bacterium]